MLVMVNLSCSGAGRIPALTVQHNGLATDCWFGKLVATPTTAWQSQAVELLASLDVRGCCRSVNATKARSSNRNVRLMGRETKTVQSPPESSSERCKLDSAMSSMSHSG